MDDVERAWCYGEPAPQIHIKAEQFAQAAIGFLAQLFFMVRCLRVTKQRSVGVLLVFRESNNTVLCVSVFNTYGSRPSISWFRDCVRVSELTMRLSTSPSRCSVSVSFFEVQLFSQLARIPIPITLWLSSVS